MDHVDHSLAPGAPALEPCFGPMRYFGTLVGRFANRFPHGRFALNGRTDQVPTNWLDRHALNGGPVGTGQKIWTVTSATKDSLRLEPDLPDGDMGFPVTMRASTEISLPGDGVLSFDITATTDAATPCSFARNGFFNLEGSFDITDHDLSVHADACLPVDADPIPTGEIADVAGTRFDLRAPRPIGKRSYSPFIGQIPA